ncbi:hypothetical protein [Candidatus Laterigemmans baculatus]|uniref:hypothetical protein n=1 Tax=Candidatus Laterigemmans baculatus TaxID=2770505 RepID=UPI0013DC487A|nr:hypothetical protein [Candidatus Laterigemmans baculatus]
MRCERFDQRFHELLDLRQEPAGDPQLLEHAAECHRCQRTLEDWLRVEDFFAEPRLESSSGSPNRTPSPPTSAASFPAANSPAANSPAASWRPAALAATLAASLLGGVWFAGGDRDRQPAAVAGQATPAAPSATPQLASIEQLGSRVAQPEWWGSVVRAAWEPVDPLAEGFRPLTNSLQTALELLTPRAGGAAIPGSGVPSPLPEDANVGLAVAPPRLV